MDLEVEKLAEFLTRLSLLSKTFPQMASEPERVTGLPYEDMQLAYVAWRRGKGTSPLLKTYDS